MKQAAPVTDSLFFYALKPAAIVTAAIYCLYKTGTVLQLRSIPLFY